MLDLHKEAEKFDSKTFENIISNLKMKTEVRMMEDIKGYFFQVKFTPLIKKGEKYDEIEVVFSAGLLKLTLVQKIKKGCLSLGSKIQINPNDLLWVQYKESVFTKEDTLQFI